MTTFKSISKKLTLLLKLSLYFVMICSSLPAVADSLLDRELKLKAEYLYRFTQFISWPQASIEAVENFTFCVVENGDFASVLTIVLANRTVTGKETTVKNISSNSNSDLLSDCHILYFSQENLSVNTIYLEKVADMHLPSLTVGNTVTFNELGGILRFQMINNKLKFEINNIKAVDAGLTISSQLLRLGGAR